MSTQTRNTHTCTRNIEHESKICHAFCSIDIEASIQKHNETMRCESRKQLRCSVLFGILRRIYLHARLRERFQLHNVNGVHMRHTQRQRHEPLWCSRLIHTGGKSYLFSINIDIEGDFVSQVSRVRVCVPSEEKLRESMKLVSCPIWSSFSG